MDEPDGASRGGGRVRKKSQKLLEMEDFASAWKEQSSASKSGQGGPVKASSPKKKCSAKTNAEGMAKLATAKEAFVASATTAVTAPTIPSAPPETDRTSKKDKDWISFSEREKFRKSEREDIPDWKSDDGNIDGTPANPKIPNNASSKTPNALTDGRSNVVKPLVVTKTPSVHFFPAERGGEIASVEIVARSEKNQLGSKRPAEGLGAETTPKKILKQGPTANGASVKTTLFKGRPVPPSPAYPSTPVRVPPLAPTSIPKNKQNNFEQELLKADLALRKQKLAKKSKGPIASLEKLAVPAVGPTPKIESIPTIIPSSSASSTSSASSPSHDSLGRNEGETIELNGTAEKKSVTFKVEKGSKTEKSKKEKKKKGKTRDEHDHPFRGEKSAKRAKKDKRAEDGSKGDRDSSFKQDADTEGYFLFCKTARRKVKKDFPTISFSDITRVAVERWNALSPREKLIWSKKATKYSPSAPSKGKASLVSTNPSSSRKTKIGNLHSNSSAVKKRNSIGQSKNSQKRALNIKNLKTMQQLQNQGLGPTELQMSKDQEVELKPDVDARISYNSASSVDQTLPSLSPVPPPQPPNPPKLDPKEFVPPSDVDYSSLDHAREESSSSSTIPASPSTLDSAANLKLLGESLTVIGTRLTATTTPLAVQGGLSVLMDSLLCAIAPLTALLTSEVPEVEDEETRKMQAQILENAAYIMPGM